MQSKLVPISEVVPNKSNPRTIRDSKFKQLVKSIQDFPEMLELRPIVVNEDMVVLGGNMRLKACHAAGLTHVHIVKASELTQEQQDEFVIKDNLGFGDWDKSVLQADWDAEKLAEWGFEVDWNDQEDEPAQEDDEDGLPAVHTDIKPGDVIQIGQHRLMCGDSTNWRNVETLMGIELADLAHNDPPYGMGKESEGVLNDNLNATDLLQFNREWIDAQFRILKPNGSWYCWGIDQPLMEIYCDILKPRIALGECTFRNLITWDKNSGQWQNSDVWRMFATADEKCLFVMMGKQDMAQNKGEFPEAWRPILTYLQQEKAKMGWSTKDVVAVVGKTTASHYFTESQFDIPTKEAYALIQAAAGEKAFTRPLESLEKDKNPILDEFRKNRAYFDNVHDNMNSVWHFDRHKSDGSEGGHATPKPILLCSRAIVSSCPKDGLVVDFFMGSGSTMVAAHQVGRRCYGMELDPAYCQTIVDRMKRLDPEIEVILNP